MDLSLLYMAVGFIFAAYSVVGNDSMQTLGTYINSNRDIKWYYLWGLTSIVLVTVLCYGWFMHADVTFGRLNKIPFNGVQWYHLIAVAALVVLTRLGIPVSTSFLILAVFSSELVLRKMVMKSLMGYGLSMAVAIVVWLAVAWLVEKYSINYKTDQNSHKRWRIFQTCSTMFLWSTWIMHDMANIMVYLPRPLGSGYLFMGVLAVLVGWLAYIFYSGGGKIQGIVKEKHNSSYIKSATLIDLVFALILLYFKEVNDIPMSTTWVFVGLLTGREIAITFIHAFFFRSKVQFKVCKKYIKKLKKRGLSKVLANGIENSLKTGEDKVKEILLTGEKDFIEFIEPLIGGEFFQEHKKYIISWGEKSKKKMLFFDLGKIFIGGLISVGIAASVHLFM